MITPFFVRCVGIGTGIRQLTDMRAYDHRLICALDGEGEIWVDGVRYPLSAGATLLIKPECTYRVLCGTDQSIAVINFDASFEYSHLADPIPSVRSSVFYTDRVLRTNLPFDIPPMPIFVNSGCVSLLREMYDIYMSAGNVSCARELALSSRLMYFISMASRMNSEGAAVLHEQIYAFVVENATSDISISDTAKHFNYSESYVSKLLRAHYNTSFKQLVIDIRLKKALWLLENTDSTCTEIASALGFCNLQHFSYAFRKKYGKNPKSARL